MAEVSLRGVHKRFGELAAVERRSERISVFDMHGGRLLDSDLYRESRRG